MADINTETVISKKFFLPGIVFISRVIFLLPVKNHYFDKTNEYEKTLYAASRLFCIPAK